MKKLAIAALIFLASAAPVLAHSGGLDKNGCHQNNQTHVYECHQGALKGQTFKTKQDAEKALTTAQSPAKNAPQTAAVPPSKTTTPAH